MIHIQKELTKTGFSINPLSYIIKKNKENQILIH
ncbi:Uncharacterised protein [Chryseobacterium nakagawai]|nr:Uncharacterised protein [Chryseobacterium nakagawai]